MAAVRFGDQAELADELAVERANATARDEARDALRPTREPLRPTRDALGVAPFVAAPPLPRIAPAPRVGVARTRAPERARLREPSSAPSSASLALRPVEAVPAPRPAPSAYVIARYRRDVLVRAVVTLRARGLAITPMREAAPGPIGLGTELARTLRRGTLGATALGAIGALLGALLVRSEALVPSFGWIPGPLVGAAFGAGVLGVIGFVIAAVSLLFAPSSTVSALAGGDRGLLVVGGVGASSDLAAAIIESGGEVLAHGPR